METSEEIDYEGFDPETGLVDKLALGFWTRVDDLADHYESMNPTDMSRFDRAAHAIVAFVRGPQAG
jgi:hypothetical protein